MVHEVTEKGSGRVTVGPGQSKARLSTWTLHRLMGTESGVGLPQTHRS